MVGKVRGRELSGEKGRMKRRSHRIVDILLFVDFVALMALPINYGAAHEWAGVAAFVLIIAHLAINGRRMMRLLKRHDLAACVNLVIELALLLGIIAMAASSLVLSEHAFAWLPVIPGAAWARIAHLCASYWTFALAFIHFGLHLQVFLGRPLQHPALRWVLRILFAACLIYGAYSFVELGIWSYMTLRIQFAFVDPNIAASTLQYGSMAVALSGCGHCIACAIEFTRKHATSRAA